MELITRVVIDYTNHRGERRKRLVYPASMRWGSTEWHPEEQWLLKAYCAESRMTKEFAFKDIHSWEPDKAEPDDFMTKSRGVTC